MQLIITIKNLVLEEFLICIVTFIGIVDITVSIPLVILWGNDLYFKDDFVFTMEEWKSSIICFISFGISIHFVLIAPFLTILLSYVRHTVIKNPFHVTFKRTEFTFKLITFGYACSWLFASFLTILFWLISGKMPNVYCSPFFDPSETFSLAVISSFFLISIHLFAFLLNFVIHVNLILVASKAQGKGIKMNSKRQNTKPLIIQIIYITFSHLLCWISDMIIYIIIYFMKNYSIEMILWKLACISPLNSILIPIIFIMKRLKS